MAGHVRATVRSTAGVVDGVWSSPMGRASGQDDGCRSTTRAPLIFVSLYHRVGPPEARDADGGTRPQYLYPFSSEENRLLPLRDVRQIYI